MRTVALFCLVATLFTTLPYARANECADDSTPLDAPLGQALLQEGPPGAPGGQTTTTTTTTTTTNYWVPAGISVAGAAVLVVLLYLLLRDTTVKTGPGPGTAAWPPA